MVMFFVEAVLADGGSRALFSNAVSVFGGMKRFEAQRAGCWAIGITG
jgi:hypothetical protein